MMFATSDSASLWAGSIATIAAVFLTAVGGLWSAMKNRAEQRARMDAFIQSNTEEHQNNSAKIDMMSDQLTTKIDSVANQVGDVREDVRDMRRDFVRHLENHEKG